MASIICIMIAVVVLTSGTHMLQPPNDVETIDPTTLHLQGEFMESNLRPAVESDGSVTVRILAQQYMWAPTGNPKRGIPGCATCHGPGGYRLGAPTLAGQTAAYIEQQLQNCAQRVRRNDMNMPMRTIAPLINQKKYMALAYRNATLQ